MLKFFMQAGIRFAQMPHKSPYRMPMWWQLLVHWGGEKDQKAACKHRVQTLCIILFLVWEVRWICDFWGQKQGSERKPWVGKSVQHCGLLSLPGWDFLPKGHFGSQGLIQVSTLLLCPGLAWHSQRHPSQFSPTQCNPGHSCESPHGLLVTTNGLFHHFIRMESGRNTQDSVKWVCVYPGPGWE